MAHPSYGAPCQVYCKERLYPVSMLSALNRPSDLALEVLGPLASQLALKLGVGPCDGYGVAGTPRSPDRRLVRYGRVVMVSHSGRGTAMRGLVQCKHRLLVALLDLNRLCSICSAVSRLLGRRVVPVCPSSCIICRAHRNMSQSDKFSNAVSMATENDIESR
jgi:hypothetical protein